MSKTIRQHKTIQSNGVLEIHSPDLQKGDDVDVVIHVQVRNEKHNTFLSLIGSAKGSFQSAQEVDPFIRQERDRWD